MKLDTTYALDDNGTLLYASSIEKKDNVRYYCPACSQEMGLRKGTKRIHHFYHKENACSSETYLHSVGKRILYNMLKKEKNKNRNFTISNCIVNNIVKTESYKDFWETPVETDEDRLSIVLHNYLTTNKKEKIKYFFDNIKKSKDRELIGLFTNLHYWLRIQISDALTEEAYTKLTHFKHNYSSLRGGKIGDYQLISKETTKDNLSFIRSERRKKEDDWKNFYINENNLVNYIIFLNTFLNFTYIDDHVSKMYIENIEIIKYLRENISENCKKELIKKFYEPYFLKKNSTLITSFVVPLYETSRIYLDSQKYKGFLPDVLLQNEDNLTFFEISVTHKCTEKKVNSGEEIIEISIKTIEDLENLEKMDFCKLEINCYNVNQPTAKQI